MSPPPPLNFGPQVNFKKYFFQYNAVISRAVACIRQGGRMPPLSPNFESSYGPGMLIWNLIIYFVSDEYMVYEFQI